MIRICKKEAYLEFGTGDICIASGYIESEQGVGFVTFCNQEPREIGKMGDVELDKKYSIDDFPVVMKFSKKESIDVVIKALLDAKKLMK